MATRTINGSNAGNTINVLDDTGGYKVTGSGFTVFPAGLPPFTDTDLVINTFDATGGIDYVNLSGLTAGSGVSFTSININGAGGTQIVTGSQFAETISTGSGSDTINAGAGDDALTGGSGADVMDGQDGSDTYNIAGMDVGGDIFNDTGASGTDTINVTGALSGISFGVAGTNYSAINGFLPFAAGATYAGIEIFDGNNHAINGNNNGSDIFDLSGFTSATQVGVINTANATGGTDYVNVSTADAGVTVNGGGGTQIVVGSSFGDTIDGKTGNDSITGGDGDDTITGGGNADVMDGGNGNDTFNVSGLDIGGDIIVGGSGNDTIKNTAAAALGISSFGPSGSGTAATYSSIETLDGNSQAINGSNAANEVVNLSLIGQVLNVTGVNMLDGADTVWTAASHIGAVTAYNGGGSSSIPIDSVNLVFSPTQLGAFSLADIATLNVYVAAPAGKVLAPAGGTHNIASLQFLTRNFEAATVNVLVDGQVYNITACLIGIDNVVVATPTQTTINGTPDQDLIVGNALNNTINGLPEADLIFAGAGHDSIKGGAGADCLFGGEGNDTFLANLGEAEYDALQGGPGTDTLQRTTDGGQGNLVLNGFSATNGIERVNLDAGGSNRNIEGNASGNVLDFSATTLLSGSVFGLGGNDAITATNSATRTYDGGAGNDTLNGGTQADVLNGGADDDTISGNGGNDSIKGGVGADNLDGGEGDDIFYANLTEAEFDVLQGGNGVDTLQRTTDGGQGNLVLNSFLASNGIERVNLDAGGSNRNVDGNANGNVLDFSATTLLSGSVFGLDGNDAITATSSAARSYDGGNDNDTLNGGTQNDTLIGGAGDDTIAGDGGNDRIIGGAGNDALSGGSGNDVFRFNNPGEGIDTISDYSVVDDQFDISSSGFAGVGGLGTLSAARFAFLGAETTSTRIVYDSVSGNLFYDADGTGATPAVQFAVLPVGLPLTNADFSIGF